MPRPEQRIKHPEYYREYDRKYRQTENGKAYLRKYSTSEKRRKVSRAFADRKRVERMALFRKLKDVPCADCGNRYPYYVMDFDHNGNKKFLVTRSWSRSLTAIVDEVAKCDVVCANCHRIRSFASKQLGAGRPRKPPTGLIVSGGTAK